MARGADCRLAIHADWSLAPAKRWMTVAHRDGPVWRVSAPCPVGPPETLLSRLQQMAAGGAVALGVDFPLGLPRDYAARHANEADFRAFLRGLLRRPGFFHPCADLSDVTPDRPFYPARGQAGMTRAAHAAALGLDNAACLSRRCDQATATRPAGAPLFWTLGANQTGKAALNAWRDLVLPALERPGTLLLWPFDGDLLDLLAPGTIVMAETYPAEAMRQIGVRLTGSKMRQADRAGAAAALHQALAVADGRPDAKLTEAIATGFPAAFGLDDGFDSLLGVLCVLGVLDGRRPDGIPPDPWLRRWEGWVLGQSDAAAAVSPICTKPDGAIQWISADAPC